MHVDTNKPEPKLVQKPASRQYLPNFALGEDWECPKGWHPLFTGVVGVDFHVACESDNPKGSDERGPMTPIIREPRGIGIFEEEGAWRRRRERE